MTDTKEESRYAKKIYELLPAIYRQHDAELGKPLEALLNIIAEQIGIVEDDIERLYDNWFVETCDEWILPYIADLLGAKTLHSVSLSQRAWVANTISYRRRKGTLSMLEQLARDTTGWNARAVEFFQLLSTTQHMNHIRSNVNVDLRDPERMALLNTPFDTIPHSVEVRNIRSNRGYYNIPNIGLFLWRLQAYPVNDAPASGQNGKFRFNQLGLDMQLFNSPETETSESHIVERVNVPAPISRLELFKHLEDYYASEGKDKSIKIKENGSTVSIERIIVCDLSDWRRPPAGKVAIDPELGRITFPDENERKVHVSYYYGFSSDIGGGFYSRPQIDTKLIGKSIDKIYKISKSVSPSDIYSSISDAINDWQNDNRPDAILEIMDSEFYNEDITLDLQKATLVIRSSQEQRPLLKSIEIRGDEDSIIILDGLLIKEGIKIKDGKIKTLAITHCTLVPKYTLEGDEHLSILLEKGNDNLSILLDHSISGSIALKESEALLKVRDSIIDGKVLKEGGNSNNMAMECYKLDIENSTVFGSTSIELIEMASNTIFTEKVTAKRLQEGCVRFCYIPKGSQTPRRYRCLPSESNPNIDVSFTSENYPDPGYAQLRYVKEIFEGADNGAEMGVFNHLQQPQRITNLRTNLDEYMRFTLEAGIFLTT